jgi:hypothetical protein
VNAGYSVPSRESSVGRGCVLGIQDSAGELNYLSAMSNNGFPF